MNVLADERFIIKPMGESLHRLSVDVAFIYGDRDAMNSGNYYKVRAPNASPEVSVPFLV